MGRFSYGVLLILFISIIHLNCLSFVVAIPNASSIQKSEESSTIHGLLPEQQGVFNERNTTFSISWTDS